MHRGRIGSLGIRRAVVGGVALCAVWAAVFSAASPDARGQCLPPLIVCPPPPPPPPPPPAGGPPQAKITGISDVRDRSATFSAEINPGGLTTTYSWGYSSTDGYETTLAPANSYTLPAGSSWVPINTHFRLLPGHTYYSLTLTVSNADGETQSIWPKSFTTTEHPRLRLVLRRRWVTYGQPFAATVRASGTFNTVAAIKFHVAKFPFRKWRLADADPSPRRTRNRVTAQPCFSVPIDQCTDLDRNFKIRATLGSARTPGRLVYVLPYLVLSTKLENDGTSDLILSALVHRMRRYPRQRVYFYAASSRSGPYTRIGSARFRPAVYSGIYGTQLHATLRIRPTRRLYLKACFRHRLVRDMGPRFTDTRCGRLRN
jgi:hypothetical protein